MQAERIFDTEVLRTKMCGSKKNTAQSKICEKKTIFAALYKAEIN